VLKRDRDKQIKRTIKIARRREREGQREETLHFTTRRDEMKEKK